MKRKALFVGIDNYTRGIPALSCARNDANALLEYFLKHGYAEDDVSILRDGRTSEILDELDEQTKRLKPGDLFLFFFAGHGYTIEKSDGSFDRCLAGADDRRDRILMGKEGISLSEIKDRADKARCPFVVILDACQTKIDTSRAADISRKDVCNQRDLLAISSVVNRKGRSGQSIPFVVINSCDVGEVAYELEEKEQGLFTFSMLETLKQMDNPAFDEKLLALISSRMGEHGGGYSQHPKLMLADASDIFDIPIFPVADSSHETLVLCPVCGFRNREEQTFRCRVCGRDYLCKAHFNKQERCCEDCAAAKRREREAAERRAREEEERTAPPPQNQQPSTTSSLVVCPMCGKKNRPEDTFKCRECGHENLCIRHQDEDTFLCVNCAASKTKEIRTPLEDAPTREPSAQGGSVKDRVCSGNVIGGFKILEPIRAGAGAQGSIYRAECVADVHHLVPVGTMVALKVMAVQDKDQELWRYLQKRTDDLAKIDHPNVVKYFGCFSEQGDFTNLHVVVQELLTGETLKDLLACHPSGLDADEALRIIDATLAGLSYTAACGVVHRDVKPGNIFVCLNAEGGVGAVKLIGFELAKQIEGTRTASATATENIRGSLDYMAPDFKDSDFHGDVQSDVFSMGVVLHEVLTGAPPYQRINAGDKQALLKWVARWSQACSGGESPIRIRGHVKRILAHADEVLSHALAPKREQRYRDFDEFRNGCKTIRYRQLSNGQNTYFLLQFIRKTGFSEAFKARHKQTGRFVAIKHLLKADYVDRFEREAKIIKKFNDSYFVRFIDFFTLNYGDKSEFFIVMDYLPGMPGSSLRDAIRRAGNTLLPFRETLVAFARFAHGLSVLHSEGIIHRNIKPSNLYYPEGHPERSAIMDFTIARDTKGPVGIGVVPGTLDYMPPEVCFTADRGGPGWDIYALGHSLYEALTGKRAYPLLPTGTAGYSSFFDRSRNMIMPDLSDSVVVKNVNLHDLLVRMTHPYLSKRLADAREVERRLLELAEAAKE